MRYLLIASMICIMPHITFAEDKETDYERAWNLYKQELKQHNLCIEDYNRLQDRYNQLVTKYNTLLVDVGLAKKVDLPGEKEKSKNIGKTDIEK